MNKEKLRTLWTLFATFFKIGAFTFGGGYAMIPLIQHETVEKHHWINDDDMLDIIAIAESTPGPIAINSSTFVGYRAGGTLGAACATFGLVLPSFLLITLISRVLQAFEEIQVVRYAFFGIRAGVLALIVKALWTMFKKCPKNPLSYCISLGAFALAALVKLNVIVVIVLCAAVGLVSSLLAGRRKA